MPERCAARRSHTHDNSPTLPDPPPAKRVLVTGAEGFVGARVVARLLEQKRQVVALDLRSGGEPPPPGVIRVVADLGSDGWQRWAEGCDAAVHLAGTAREEPRRKVTFERVHILATRNLVASLARLGVKRLIHVSAEGAGRDAASAFLRSKWAGEEAVRASGLRWTIVKPSLVFGPGDCFSATLAAWLRRLPLFPVPARGSLRLQPLAVQDLVAALTAAVDRQDLAGREIRVCGPEVVTLDELIRRAGRAVGHQRALVHLGPRTAGFLVGALRFLPRPPITPDQLVRLQVDSTSDATPTSDILGAPAERFEGPTWLSPAPPARRPVGA